MDPLDENAPTTVSLLHLPFDAATLDASVEQIASMTRSATSLCTWTATSACLDALQRLARHHPDLVRERLSLPTLLSFLALQADSPRSSLARSALLTLADLFAVASPLQEERWDDVLQLLCQKSCSEKRFLADAALSALSALVTHQGNVVLFAQLVNKQSSKNARLVGVAARFTSQTAEKLGDADFVAACTSEIATKLVVLSLTSKSVEARKPCLDLVKRLSRLCGPQGFEARLVGVSAAELLKLAHLLDDAKRASHNNKRRPLFKVPEGLEQ